MQVDVAVMQGCVLNQPLSRCTSPGVSLPMPWLVPSQEESLCCLRRHWPLRQS